ncbi:MAG TPA: LPS assembly protein LptD [Steroidobacteraceae bacterium]|nr:LPS assembly protein LptD [Steroidobacteraceae bacterium]
MPTALHVRAAAVLAICALASARAADLCPAPPRAPRPPPSLAAGDHRIHIESDSATLGADGDAVVAGKVLVLQDARRVSADSVTYDRRTGRIRVKGSVHFSDPRLRIRSDAGSYDQTGRANFADASFQLLDRRGRGFAQRIDVRPGGKVLLDKVRYTTCPPGAADWMLHASSIALDTARQQGAAHNAYLVFKGVPLFYTPYLSFPLGSQRQSGFLYPSFAHTGNNGYSLASPYYFNLAPNYDLTLTPGYMSARGVDLAGQYRYLTETSHGQIDATYLPDDSQTHGERDYLHFADLTDLNSHNRIGIDVASVSDSNYFQDFAVGSAETSMTYLERRIAYQYRDSVWRVAAMLQNFQTIDISVDPSLRPYSRVPDLNARALWRVGDTGFEFALHSEAVDFLREVGPTGLRLDVTPELRWSRRTAGYFFVPAIGWNFTQYDLQHAASGDPATPTRALPYARLDTGLIFERDDAANGRPAQTLEPRMVYSYVPYRNQNDLPVFDTALPDLNLTELYQTNRFVGADRIGDANQLSLGVTTRWFDSATGRQFLSATLGQTRYFTTPRVTLPGQTPIAYGASNVVGDVEVTAYRDVSVKLGYQWNPYTSTTEKSEVSVQYRPDSSRMVNLGYRFQHGVLDQWDGSFAWPIAGHWNAVGRLVYSTLDRQTIEQVAGIEYRSCCWSLQIVQRRYVVNRTGALDTSVAMQLELLGMSSVGKSADSFLRRAIGGYSAVGPAP